MIKTGFIDEELMKTQTPAAYKARHDAIMLDAIKNQVYDIIMNDKNQQTETIKTKDVVNDMFPRSSNHT